MMFLTPEQKYILFILEQTLCLRKEQVPRLLQGYCGDNPGQTATSALRQLRYLGKIAELTEQIIVRPNQERADGEMLEAVEVMLELCGGSRILTLTRDREPFTLCFIPEAGAERVFALLHVPPGTERGAQASTRLAAGNDTVIFMLEEQRQMNLLNIAAPHYFAVAAEQGYRFYKPNII